LSFDETIKQKIKTIDIGSYLQNEKVPGTDMTYIQYFYGKDEVYDESGAPVKVNINVPIDPNVEYAIFYMAVRGESWKETAIDIKKLFVGAETVSIASGYIIGGPLGAWRGAILIPSAIIKVAGAAVKHPVLALIIIGTGAAVEQFSINKAQKLIETRCGEETGETGCFLLAIVPYESGELGKYCYNFESIP